MFYHTLAMSHLYVLLTALTELEELNVDRTVITDEGCTVLPSKFLFQHFWDPDIFKRLQGRISQWKGILINAETNAVFKL